MAVEFNEQEDALPARSIKKAKPGVTALLIRKGFAKDQKEAERILLIVAGCIFALALFMFWRSLG